MAYMEEKFIDRSKQPYRIYKPLFIDENYMRRDMDRELESISQSLLWVTNAIDQIVLKVNPLLPEDGKIVIEYPTNRR